jgi:CheY-like chemotaxis protein
VEATKLIRKKGYTGCIVAVTGNAMDTDVREFLAAGADVVVTKPMKMTKLDAILQSINDGGGDVTVTRQLLRKIGTL